MKLTIIEDIYMKKLTKYVCMYVCMYVFILLRE